MNEERREDVEEPAGGGAEGAPGPAAGARTARAVFMPSGRRGEFAVGTPLLQAARELGVDIDSICGGRARCGRCQVEAVEGRTSAPPPSPPTCATCSRARSWLRAG
jgi:hypothetical protein